MVSSVAHTDSESGSANEVDATTTDSGSAEHADATDSGSAKEVHVLSTMITDLDRVIKNMGAKAGSSVWNKLLATFYTSVAPILEKLVVQYKVLVVDVSSRVHTLSIMNKEIADQDCIGMRDELLSMASAPKTASTSALLGVYKSKKAFADAVCKVLSNKCGDLVVAPPRAPSRATLNQIGKADIGVIKALLRDNGVDKLNELVLERFGTGDKVKVKAKVDICAAAKQCNAIEQSEGNMRITGKRLFIDCIIASSYIESSDAKRAKRDAKREAKHAKGQAKRQAKRAKRQAKRQAKCGTHAQ